MFKIFFFLDLIDGLNEYKSRKVNINRINTKT